jgi:transaldolase
MHMKFFVDTADTAEIKSLASSGLLDGVTTNPSLVAKTGKKFTDIIREICAVVPGPVSAEVAATDYDGMMREAFVLREIAKNVTIKVPLTPDGLRACRRLTSDGTMVNVTLCFSAAQALLAAKAGASFISPFIGRLDDAGQSGMALIADIMQIYSNYQFKTEVLVASVRNPMHVVEAAKLGAHVVTLPPAVLRALFNHPLTDKGLAAFLADWGKTGQTIA